MISVHSKPQVFPFVQVVDKRPADVLDEIEAAVYSCVTSIMNGMLFLFPCSVVRTKQSESGIMSTPKGMHQVQRLSS
jgi:hypothetical protein